MGCLEFKYSFIAQIREFWNSTISSQNTEYIMKWKAWWTSCTTIRLPIVSINWQRTKSHLKTHRRWCQMDRVTLSQEIHTSKKRASFVEVVTSINNELFVVPKTSNFLFSCVLEFASQVTLSWLSTFVFVDN